MIEFNVQLQQKSGMSRHCCCTMPSAIWWRLASDAMSLGKSPHLLNLSSASEEDQNVAWGLIQVDVHGFVNGQLGVMLIRCVQQVADLHWKAAAGDAEHWAFSEEAGKLLPIQRG